MEISGEYHAPATLPPAKNPSTHSIWVAGVVTRLQSVCYEVRIAAEAVDFSLLWLVQTGSAAHAASCSVGNGVCFSQG